MANDVSSLIAGVATGDRQALDALFPLVYEELVRLAHRQRRRWDGNLTLTTTALCNYARDRKRLKRGGGRPHLDLDQAEPADAAALELSDDQTDRLAALDEALRRFEAIAERQCRVVECRFFGGMSVEDTAAALSMSERSVKRDWAFARAWLLREMQVQLAD